MKTPSSYRFFNGPIVTMDTATPVAGEIVTRGSTIAWIGRAGSAPREFRRARPVDLQGRLLLPAFTDCHTHILHFAVSLSRVNLQGAASLRAALRRIEAHSAQLPDKTSWITGTGFDVNLWGGRWPSRRDLDRILPGRPAAFFSHDEHTLWVNTAALRRCGIDADTAPTGGRSTDVPSVLHGRDGHATSIGSLTPDPAGGQIVRDADGTPTGILRETAYRLVWNNIPKPGSAQTHRLLITAQHLAHQQGVAAIADMGESATLAAFQRLHDKNKLRLRLWKSIPLETMDAAIAAGLHSGMGNHWMKIGAVKIFLDGALGSQTAWMLKPYREDCSNLGVCRMDKRGFRDVVRKATAAGLSVCVHAIGDAAVRQAIDVLRVNRARFPGCQPPRIEHLQLMNPADMARLRGSGIIASMQPSHLLTDRDYADRHWGRRARWAFALRTLWDQGVPLAFGSDVPIEPMAPLTGIAAAVWRAQRSDKRGPWYGQERLTPWEAIWGFTAGSALACGDQDNRGSIREGRLADLVVLDRNILTDDPRRIFDTRVGMTFVDGICVYGGE